MLRPRLHLGRGSPRRRRGLAGIATVTGVVLSGFLLAAAPSLAAALASESFAHARQPRTWSFPRDHGAHPAYATEWWYFTGIVGDGQARVFGYELTFFRTALRPDAPASASAWRARDLILAHLALTDVQGDRFAMAEQVQRAAAGLAGADSTALQVWTGGWSARATLEGFQLQASSGGLAVDLQLTRDKGVVLHGQAGLSRKTADGRQASHYYSMPRLHSVGTVAIDGVSHTVAGTTWMDHEFFTGDTPREGLGWDWFSVRLQDGRDLMLYVVRSGSAGPGEAAAHAAGTMVLADGTARSLDTAELSAVPTRWWTSPQTAIRYPVGWRLNLPRESVSLEVTALLPQQEIHATQTVGFSYWEGACRYDGSVAGAPVSGEGYVELTGYGGPSQGNLPAEDGGRPAPMPPE